MADTCWNGMWQQTKRFKTPVINDSTYLYVKFIFLCVCREWMSGKYKRTNNFCSRTKKQELCLLHSQVRDVIKFSFLQLRERERERAKATKDTFQIVSSINWEEKLCYELSWLCDPIKIVVGKGKISLFVFSSLSHPPPPPPAFWELVRFDKVRLKIDIKLRVKLWVRHELNPLQQYLSTFFVWFATPFYDYKTIWRPSWLQFPSSQTSSSEFRVHLELFQATLLYTLRKSSGLMFILSWLKFSL